MACDPPDPECLQNAMVENLTGPLFSVLWLPKPGPSPARNSILSSPVKQLTNPMTDLAPECRVVIDQDRFYGCSQVQF